MSQSILLAIVARQVTESHSVSAPNTVNTVRVLNGNSKYCQPENTHKKTLHKSPETHEHKRKTQTLLALHFTFARKC